MANPDFAPMAFAKRERGTYQAERKRTKQDRKKAEAATMLEARIRDGHKCRWPGCKTGLRVEVAHQAHRGMGGNPSGDRTERHTLISLCLQHHGWWDHGNADIEPLTALGFDGPADFYRCTETGREHVGREKAVGVLEARR